MSQSVWPIASMPPAGIAQNRPNTLRLQFPPVTSNTYLPPGVAAARSTDLGLTVIHGPDGGSGGITSAAADSAPSALAKLMDTPPVGRPEAGTV